MRGKRLFVSIVLGILIMGADMTGLMLVNRSYRPQHPPAWVTHCFYYFLAWPLSFTMLIFHRAAGDVTHGPTFLAVVAAGTTGVVIVNIANPSAPRQLGAVATPGDAHKVAVKGSSAFVANYPSSMNSSQ